MQLGDGLGFGAFWLSLVAGAASFLSPCVLPLLPGYLSFVSGVSVDELQAGRRRVLPATLAFVLGFAVVFTAAGAGVAFVGEAIRAYERQLQIAAGILLIVLGLLVAGAIPSGQLERERRVLPFRSPKGIVGAMLTGFAFALGWTPCVGPILASILTLAASGRDPLGGALLLFVYSVGLGAPFVVAGLLFSKLLNVLDWAKRHVRAIRIVSGVLLAGYGVLIILGRLGWLSGLLGGSTLFQL
ncbi:MAG: cytochrome c biogenesis protein CcdA [Actinobacteria bacterium]|nr:cytochrome c biogenesis protein CcdA [Actinomycetota bacterium]